MKVPAALMDTIDKANMLHGINLKDAPKKNPDGSYNMNMTPKQFQQFQDNQQNPPPPKSSAPGAAPGTAHGTAPGAAPGSAPGAADPTADDSDKSISVTQDPSMFGRKQRSIKQIKAII